MEKNEETTKKKERPMRSCRQVKNETAKDEAESDAPPDETEVGDAELVESGDDEPSIATVSSVGDAPKSDPDRTPVVPLTGIQIKQMLGNRELNLRLQPCDKALPVTSVSAQSGQSSSTSTVSVINLPTVYKPAQINPGAGEAVGETGTPMVSVYRVFNTAELMNASGTLMNTERFASSLGRGKQQPQPDRSQSVKRKRGRPRLYPPPGERPSNPILSNPKPPSSSPGSSTKALSKFDDQPPLIQPAQVKFSIADLPPEERPSFAFRRDLRKQLKQKSLDDRIMWALGKKPPTNEEVTKTSRSGRVIRPTVYVTENDEYEVTPPAPTQVQTVSPLPPPPKKRGRPRKDQHLGDITVRPTVRTSAPVVAPPSPEVEEEEPEVSPAKSTELKKAISAIEDSLLSEDYINRNLEYWISKKKELEERRLRRKLERGPPKSVNVVVQSSSVVEDDDDSHEMTSDAGSQEIRHVSEVNPLRQSLTLARSREYRARTRDDQYRPILPRPNNLPKKAPQEVLMQRLENFRKRAEGESKMRLIRGLDYIPVQDGDEPDVQYKKYIQQGMEERPEEEVLAKANSKRNQEETEGDRELNQLINEALRETRAAKRKASSREEDEEIPEPSVDIDADDDDDSPQPVLQSVMSLRHNNSSPAAKQRKLKPVSHGTLTDPSITRFVDPDVTPRPLQKIAPRPSRKAERTAEQTDDQTAEQTAEPAATVDDDEPPIITSKPTTSTLAKPASVDGADEDDSQAPEEADGEEKSKAGPGRKRQARKTPTWPFGPSAPEEKRVFRRPSKPSTKIAPTTERRLIYSLMQNAAQLAVKPNNNSEEMKVEEVDPLSYIVLESESESESDEETEDGEKKKEKPRKNFSCAAVTIKLAATTKSSLVFAPPTDVYDEATHIEYEEGMDSGVEENGVLWKFPTQYFNGAKYQEIAPPEEPAEPVPEPRKRNTNRQPSCSMNWAAPDYGVLPPNNKCPHCNRSFNDNARLWRHLISHSDKKPFVCSLCGKGHRLPEYLSYHFRLHHSSTEDLLPCPHCPKRALFYSQLEAHLLNKHEAPRPYQCGQCVQAFALEASLENHVRSFHDPQPHMCDFCGHTFADDVARLYHQRSHAQERPFQCADCNKSFRSKVLLGHHRMVEHEIERQHECPKCMKSFFFLKDMHKHMAASHTEPEPYQCTHCPAQFARKIQLTRHVEKSHRTAGSSSGQANRPFRCQVCQACFVSERLLLRHQANVHSERHFPSAPHHQQQPPPPPPAGGSNQAEAGASAESKRKMFSCRYCDLLFTARTAVTQHIESVHIDTMALRCRHCRQPCVNHADLERHILEHKERRETLQTRRPNRRLCVACGEMLPSRAALEKHLKEEHDELVQFMCPICGEFFLTNQLYYEHTCRQEAVSEIRRTRYSGQEEAAETTRDEPGDFSTDEEGGAHQQQPGGQAAPVEGQETVEAYPEWQRRPQWPEFPREESGHYYSGW